MRLNTLKPAPGEKQSRHRVGRGGGSGWGKTGLPGADIRPIKSVSVLISLPGEWEYNQITIFPRNGGKYHGKSSI